jgi:hypothetical protein
VNEFSVILTINTEMTPSAPLPTYFVDYNFKLGADGSIFFDEELEPDQLGVKTGDKFEVILAPGVGIIFKKLTTQ